MQVKKQLSLSKIRSSKPTISSENMRSASPEVASPPRGFGDSLQLPKSPIQDHNTIQNQHKQKKKTAPSRKESPIRTLVNENVCSTSPEAPPPHGFADSLQHDEDLQHHRSPRHTESPIVSRRLNYLLIKPNSISYLVGKAK